MRITIFCASSPSIDEKYFTAAKELATILVSAKHSIIYGGGDTGLMGAVADTVLEMGGEITGVIPDFMKEVEWMHKGVEDMIVVDSMAERKKLLIKKSDAIVVLAGGTGTLEELMEVVSLKKLGKYPNPIVILNSDGFYDLLQDFMVKMVDEKFMNPEHLSVWEMVSSPSDVLESIKNQERWGEDVINFASVK